MSIVARNLTKRYRTYTKTPGTHGALKDLIGRSYSNVTAIDCLDIVVDPGEILGLVGANGAGKTTLLKMLSGILTPNSGELEVLGYRPARRDPEFLRRIGFVMGNRRQLQWDLPAADSFEYQRLVYGVDGASYRRTLERLSGMLGVTDLLHTQVRRLSLGERMKMEFILGLIHAPEILFLDEPTLGLDLASQQQLRRFISEYNNETGATIIVTSHYSDDIDQTCGRVAVLSQGLKVFDRKAAFMREACLRAEVVEIPFTPVSSLDDITMYGELLAVSQGAAIVHLSEQGRALWAKVEDGAVSRGVAPPPTFNGLIGKLMTMDAE